MLDFFRALWDKFQNDPVFMRQLNGWLAIIWLAASLPICFFLSTSVPFLVFVSVYAIVTGHWSTWQGSRIEVKQQEESVADDIIERLDKDTDVTVTSTTTTATKKSVEDAEDERRRMSHPY